MSREIRGQIYKVSLDYKIISIQVKNKLEFFYLQPRFVKEFRKFLYSGVFVNFTCDDKKFKMRKRLVSRVIAFERIIGNRYLRKFSYFEHKTTRQNILQKIEKYQYRLFLDLEMTLQRSRHDYEEIIQAGAILVDKNNQALWCFRKFIKPTKLQKVSQKTLQFLNITEDEINNGISYQDFYEIFKVILLRYKPCVIVWGNNDKSALKKSYTINKVSPIFNDDDFLDLQQVLKKYYNFNYELGLFTTAKIFNIACGVQTHDAFVDADITRMIFERFYETAIHNIELDFEKEMSKYLR